MTTKRTTAPAELAVPLAAAKETLRIDESDTSLDMTIQLQIRSITEDAEHEIRRSLVTQGWQLALDWFQDALRLDYAPIISVQSVRYRDADNVLQTLHPDDYELDNISEPGWLVPAPGKTWPATYDRVHAVVVDYTAGYGPTADTVPACVQHYILARLAECFDSSGREFKETAQSNYVAGLLDRVRVY